MKDQIEEEVRMRVEQRVEARLNADCAAADAKKRKEEELEAIMEENKRRIQIQQAKVAEERLQQLENERKEREERERRQLEELKYQRARLPLSSRLNFVTKCANCGEKGHWRAECPNLQKIDIFCEYS